jgi:23S rRNA pseudouridine1911/1915/1917 synthase
VYRGPFPGKPILDESGAARLALHAAELGFQHPITSEQMKFVMPLPGDMTALIDRLRQSKAKRG